MDSRFVKRMQWAISRGKESAAGVRCVRADQNRQNGKNRTATQIAAH
jgi:hypothetical protein